MKNRAINNANDFLTSIDIVNDPELNPYGYNCSTINRVINKEGLHSQNIKSKFYLNTTHSFNQYQWVLFHQY